MMNTEKHKN